jgi:hypothetical protein
MTTVARLNGSPKTKPVLATVAPRARKDGGRGCARGIIVRVVVLRVSALWHRRR